MWALDNAPQQCTGLRCHSSSDSRRAWIARPAKDGLADGLPPSWLATAAPSLLVEYEILGGLGHSKSISLVGGRLEHLRVDEHLCSTGLRAITSPYKAMQRP